MCEVLVQSAWFMPLLEGLVVKVTTRTRSVLNLLYIRWCTDIKQQ